MSKSRLPASREAKLLIHMSTILSKNVMKSISAQHPKVKSIVDSIQSLDCWSNNLQANDSSAQLISEIFVDLFVSLLFTLRGLYKYADMALRSALENALNLCYFYTHPIEFGWWQSGREWYNTPHPWGEGYAYFKNLTGSPAGRRLFEEQVKREYQQLSRSIHSSSQRLQTAGSMLSPVVDRGRLGSHLKVTERTISLINTILTYTFSEEFSDMSSTEKALISMSMTEQHRSLLRMLKLL